MYSIYRFFTVLFFPILIIFIFLRIFFNKENNSSFSEKVFSTTSRNAKNNKLIWFHGASIGEMISILPVVNFVSNKKNIDVLITSNSITSGKMIRQYYKNKKNIFHQYLPLDVPHLNKKFLSVWKPNVAIFIDSEIWPNFIYYIKKRNIKLVLMNARITNKTYKRWQIFKNAAKKIFSSFDLSMASSMESFNHLKNLGAKKVKYFGNLKYIPSVKIIKQNKKIINSLKNRKIWCAASTHPGEEIFCIKVHKKIKKFQNKILTIIAPRHIKRVNAISEICQNEKLKYQIVKNANEKILDKTEILIVNSFGLLLLYYNMSRSVFMGKSLLKSLVLVGGQNPIEAARIGCKIYSGSFVYNFKEVYQFLIKNKIAKKIKTTDQLATLLIKDFKNKYKINTKKFKIIDKYGFTIFNKTTSILGKLI